MQHKYNTPQRRYVLESQPVNRRYNATTNYKNDTSSVIDYKSKTFQLMQTISQLQIRDKQNHRNVFYLQRQLEMIQRELTDFLGMMGAESLEEVRVKYQKMSDKVAQMMEDRDKPLLKEEKVTAEYEKILKEYKTIIGNQEEKMVKYQQKWKASQVLLREQLQQTKAQLLLRTTSVSQLKDTIQKIKEDSRKQTERVRAQMKNAIQEQRQAAVREKQAMAREKQRMMKEIEQREQKYKALEESLRVIKEEKGKAIQMNTKMVEVNTQMKQDLDLIKSEFRELIIQKQSIQDKHQKLKKKYKQEIQHFEMIEKQVQEKLIQVQREITFYKEESQNQQDQIQKLKKELAEKHSTFEEEFSFGDWCSTHTQTDEVGMASVVGELSLGSKRQMGEAMDQKQKKDEGTGQQSEIALNAQCYEISIRSLLEQNSRLKRTLMLLDKSKRGQTLPPQAQLQLRLLKGLSQLPSNREIQPSISIIPPRKEQEVSLQLQKMHEMQIDSPTFSKSAYNGTPDIEQAKTQREQIQQDEEVSEFKRE